MYEQTAHRRVVILISLKIQSPDCTIHLAGKVVFLIPNLGESLLVEPWSKRLSPAA